MTVRRQKGEYRHANMPELAVVLGVGESSLRTWARIPTFPEPNGEREYCIRDVVRWHLTYKAEKAVRRNALKTLAAGLGITLDGDTAKESPVVADSVARKEQLAEIEVRAKIADFEAKHRNVVRVSDVVSVVRSFGEKVRQVGEAAERATGHPVSDGITDAVEKTVMELESLCEGRG